MADPTPNLAEHLQAARAGSNDALGEALEACRAYLLFVANQELPPDLQARGGASDLVQQTFLDAQRDFHRFQGGTDAELRAWLREVLRCNVANFERHHRAQKRQAAREVPLGSPTDSGGGERAIGADTPSPSQHAMAGEQNAQVEAALAGLPADYQRVLALRYEDGLAFEEIGRLMNGITANAARKLCARALERLQSLVGPPS
jgi:RNA polymerase sigma-70 factor (ECF subfamily)